jgi:hypothetical protein
MAILDRAIVRLLPAVPRPVVRRISSRYIAGSELSDATAVELTAAALSQLEPQGTAVEQAASLRDAMRVLFPEAVALVSAAREGFMRER